MFYERRAQTTFAREPLFPTQAVVQKKEQVADESAEHESLVRAVLRKTVLLYKCAHSENNSLHSKKKNQKQNQNQKQNK